MKKIVILVLFALCGVVASELFKPLHHTAHADTATESGATNSPKHKYPEFANVFSTQSNFADTKEDLLASITAEGLVLSHTLHAKTMLDNTAKVAGTTTPVYDDAEILLFCKSDLSHALTGANPHNIVLCPYSIAIYVIHNEPERVYLSFREPDARATQAKAIKALLTRIIEEVI